MDKGAQHSPVRKHGSLSRAAKKLRKQAELALQLLRGIGEGRPDRGTRQKKIRLPRTSEHRRHVDRAVRRRRKHRKMTRTLMQRRRRKGQNARTGL